MGDISPDLHRDTLLFTGYDDDYIKVNHQLYHSSLCIHEGKLVNPWGPARIRDVTVDVLQMFLQQPPEVLIIGTGRTTAFPDASVMQFLADHHIGFECMDSRSAARTYNILLAEGRTVSAALLLPGARR
ncbi:hypothetical protein FE236_10070 [Mariprofundus erugo]|uniref:Mth938-like domain-containing protein n=1 Tax=Mariprofundus erugo TaxID=2528639 RepID=UPI0010FE604C|nr:Mth938-like domain-containing protein [Mariprofundus erugo]TLS75105.1 hypothetical protein FE236_10070 [Mariprofundus erugo]